MSSIPVHIYLMEDVVWMINNYFEKQHEATLLEDCFFFLFFSVQYIG